MFEMNAGKDIEMPKSLSAGIDHMLDEIRGWPIEHGEKSPNGSTTYALGRSAILGGTAGVMTRMEALGLADVPGDVVAAETIAAETNGAVIPRLAKWYYGGLLKAVGLATADAGVDMLLQRTVGDNVMGHDLFRPTGLEAIGMGIAAAAPCDMRIKVGVGALSWLAGRVENYYRA